MAPTKDKAVHMYPSTNPVAENGDACQASKQGKKILAPPPATRHRGVLKLLGPVPLYDFGGRMEESTLLSIVNESRDAIPLFNVTSVSTDEQRLCALENQMVNITIRFYGEGISSRNENERQHEMTKEIEAVMPKLWTPRMYLAALNISIERNRSIIIEAIYFRGNRYISINNIHWLFTEPNLNDPSQVASGLISNAGYFNVFGGELNSI